MLKIWPTNAVYPKFRGIAIALVIAGAIAAAGTAAMVKLHYATYALANDLMPTDAQPKTDAEAEQKSASLVAQYPEDPRTHLYRAISFYKSHDLPGTEQELRAGLSKTEMLKTQFKPFLARRMQGMLASVLMHEGKSDEAKQLAAPLCSTAQQDGTQPMFDEVQLCN